MPFVSSTPSRHFAPALTAWGPLSLRASGPAVSSQKHDCYRMVSPNPVAARVAAALADNPFARKRIQHTIELFGSCMMIVAFLALAIFA